MSSVSQPANAAKKNSGSMMVLGACLLGVVMGLFGLNYWHTSKCNSGSKSHEEIELMVDGLNRRLLQAESMVRYILYDSEMQQLIFSSFYTDNKE